MLVAVLVLSVELLLLRDPLFERIEKRCHHVEFICIIRQVVSFALLLILSFLKGRQVRELIPLDFADFLPGFGFESGVRKDTPENIESHVLFSHRYLNELDILIFSHQASLMDVIARLFVDLPYGAIQIWFILINLASWKTPIGALFPALDQDHCVHVVIEHNSASDRHPRFVG